LAEYIKVTRWDKKAKTFQRLREEIFRRAAGRDISKYYKEIAADLTSAFLPLADFHALRGLVTPATRAALREPDPADDVDVHKALMHELDYASSVYAYHDDDPAKVDAAGRVIAGLMTVGLETKWYSPLYTLLAVFALVNFKSQPRLFRFQDLDGDPIKTINLAFFGAVGIDVSHIFSEQK
jgi:hypothetical protein